MKYLLHLLILVFFFEGCNSQPGTATKSTSTTAKTTSAVEKSVVQDSVLRDYSLFLAGKPLVGNSVPAKILNSPLNKKYVAEMDSNFSKIEVNRLSLMRQWADAEMKTEHEQSRVLFYPFSGPDILHAMQFYPNATEYVMIALERYGSIPDFKKMDSAQATVYLNSVYQSLQDVFGKSYFITRKMVQDLQRVKVNGVIPLMCLFLERTNHPVVAIYNKHLNNDGTVVSLSADSVPSHTNDFIEIYFRTQGVDTLRKIVYFRTNLGDNAYQGMTSFKDNKALQNYLNALPDFYVYAKAASYLMNSTDFSAIRDFCLKKGKSVLQDDTGIGFKYFDKNVWTMKLYGHYAKPVSDFPWIKDELLDKAYKSDSSHVQPLSFSLGYHWGNINNQNLMKAIKK